MGNLAKDIELDTNLSIYKTVKREVDGEIKEERIIIEQVDIEGFRVQGDNAPLSKDLLCVGHSAVREEKGLWKDHYKYQNPDEYREFWFCYDKFSNKAIIKMQKHEAPMYFVALFSFLLCPLIGNAVATFVLGILGLGIFITLLTHRTKIVDVIFVYLKNEVEVLKPQELLRFINLKDIIELQPSVEEIYEGDTLIAEDIQVCRTEETEKGSWIMEKNRLLENKVKNLEDHIAEITNYYLFREETMRKKVEAKKEEVIE
jgi:hypothetical protein